MTRGGRCAVAACVLAWTGCLAVPHRGKVFGPSGQAGSVDLTFLSNGRMSREAVRERLSTFDVRIADNALFWGRWRREWDVYWIAAGGGDTGAVAGGGKATIWRRRNVLVEFDAAGRVSAFNTLGDDALLRELASAAHGPAAAELILYSLEGEEIALQGSVVAFSGRIAGAPRFACELAQLKSLKVAAESTEDSVALNLTAVVPETADTVKRRFTLTPVDLYELVRFTVAHGFDGILQ
jgi:hypothetical protein